MSGKSWDKLILLLAGLLVIGVSALFSLSALGFSEKFVVPRTTAKNEIPETEVGKTNIAKGYVEKTQTWADPGKGVAGTAVPLFVSIPIVEARGELINMRDPNAPKLRPPVDNSWLMSHNLDYLNSGVLSLDPDNDGFTTEAEWEAKTSPVDPSSHPPYARKLLFASRQQEVYLLKFAARPDPERFQIIRLPSAKWPKRDTFLMTKGQVSEDQQFRVDSFEEKTLPKGGISVDASEVSITYLPKNEKVVLVRNVDSTIPTYYAEMKFELDPTFQKYVKEGDAFTLDKIDPNTKYRVVKVNDSSVVVTYQTGTEPEQTMEIPKK
jgi:hypothetical protein